MEALIRQRSDWDGWDNRSVSNAMSSEMCAWLGSKALGSGALARKVLIKRPLVRKVLAREREALAIQILAGIGTEFGIVALVQKRWA